MTKTIDMPLEGSGISPRDATSLGIMILLWGISWPAMKACLATIPPLWMAALRFGSAGLCLFILLALQGRLRLPVRQDWPIVASVGLLQMMAFTALGLMAMMQVGAGQAALLAYTTPLWVTLVCVVLLRQRLNRSQLLAVGMGLLGILVVCSQSLVNWHLHEVWGNAMLLGAAICWAGVIVHVGLHRWHSSPLILAPWQMLLATLPLSVMAWVLEGSPTVEWTPSLVGLVTLVGPFATCLCFVISLAVGRRIPAVSMSLATLGVPVVGLLSSVLFLHESVTSAMVVGVTLIIASLLGVLRQT